MYEEEAKDDIGLQKGNLHDIDCEDEEEVRRGLTVVLWDKLEPWYSELTRGNRRKDRTDIFTLCGRLVL